MLLFMKLTLNGRPNDGVSQIMSKLSPSQCLKTFIASSGLQGEPISFPLQGGP